MIFKQLPLVFLMGFILTGCSMINPFAQNINTQGVHHVGLVVRDLQATSRFFVEAMEFEKVGENEEYPAHFVTDGDTMVTLWQVNNPESAVLFDRRNNIGLHHLAFELDSFNDLDTMYDKLKNWPNVKIELPPESLGDGLGSHMMFYEPGGIRLEFVVKSGWFW